MLKRWLTDRFRTAADRCQGSFVSRIACSVQFAAIERLHDHQEAIISAERRIFYWITLVKFVVLFAGTAVLSAYTTPVDMPTACERIGNKLTSVSVHECLERQLQETHAYTALGNPILYKEYPPLANRKPRARVLLIGGVHGDEYASFSVMFKWLRILDKYHSGLFHWHIVPALNLDGLLQSPAIRINHNGVDLNRNLPTGSWVDALLYWRKKTGSDARRYPGNSAGSENETRWLAHEIATFKPDVVVSLHAPYGLVDYDGPPSIVPPAGLGSLKFGDLATFPGSLGRYAGEGLGLPVLTIELASARYMPSDTELRKMWVDLVRWLIDRIPAAQQVRQKSAD